jgi:hypothetical protein
VKKLYRGFTVHPVEKVNYTLRHRPGTKPRYRPEVIVTNY